MTTIAFKDGRIACDSRAVDDAGSILSNNVNKVYKTQDIIYFISGPIGIGFALAQCINEGGRQTEFKDAHGRAFVHNIIKQETHLACISDGVLTSYLLCHPDEHYAIGSGEDHALTAMDCGKSAREAVMLAMLRDSSTGGDVHVCVV